MMAEKETYKGAADQAASGGLPQLDYSTWASQIFWLFLVFGALYFVLATFILPRLREGLSERSDRICLLYTSPSPRDATLSRGTW